MTETATAPGVETYSFQADVNEVLKLVVNSLYSHKEIFLRELVSNASDALDKLKFQSLTNPSLVEDDVPFEIRISADHKASTLTIEDTGIGMGHDDLVHELGTIAHSGTRKFLDKIKESDASFASLIGQFGVGFYSAFLVAHRVEVTSRAAGDSAGAFRWSSAATGSFTVEAASRPVRGTKITLHLKDDASEYLDQWRLKEIVKKYSDFVSHPILLQVTRHDKDGERTEWEQINQGKALWLRNKDEITDSEYEDFYKHLTGDVFAPLAQAHFRAEGTQEFSALLYIPRNPPIDLFLPDAHLGIRLYVQRVFIMEDCKELLPSWLRFVRGVLDSSDLPLNVSRELLQDSRTSRFIRKQLTKKVLDLIESMPDEKPGEFRKLWESFGAVIKEGLHMDWEYRDRLLKLIRFRSSYEDGWTTLADYVKRMRTDQEAIYYIIGDKLASVKTSPHLEALRQRDLEVLYLTDPVDEWVVDAIGTFENKPLVSAMKADLKLDETADEKREKQERAAEIKPLLERIKELLIDRVKDVVISHRLTDSPACLVVPQNSVHARTERLLQAHAADLPNTSRIFEVNADHRVIKALEQMVQRDARSDAVTDWVEVLYDQALLTEGSPIRDANTFAARITRMMEQLVDRGVATDG